jgi:hypothetical protein
LKFKKNTVTVKNVKKFVVDAYLAVKIEATTGWGKAHYGKKFAPYGRK